MQPFKLMIRFSRAMLQITDIISLRYEKERYTPFTRLSGEFYCPSDATFGEIMTIALYSGTTVIHNGWPVSSEIYRRDGRTVAKISSYSYSSALSSNQCPDGLISDVNLTSLVNQAGFTLPGITFQEDTPTVNYVNYYNGTSLWDGIVSYSIRACSKYPYLSGSSLIMIEPPESVRTLEVNSAGMIARGYISDFSKMVSKISMKAIDGEGEGYSVTNMLASRRNIIRSREIPFDREWIMDPEEGLNQRVNYSMRACSVDRFTLPGYYDADIMERISVTDLNFEAEISRVVVSYSAIKGVETNIYCYHDSYCN